jgi:predicted dehydrogenase
MTLDMISPARPQSSTRERRPKIGFLGAGWIGAHRMEAMLAAGQVEAVGIADPAADRLDAVAALAPHAARAAGLEDLLALDLDGIVIATPSALHAVQAVQALERGVAVFCQKPLGRTAAEAAAVVDAARDADRLLGVDLSYRHTQAMRRIREVIQAGALGQVFACDLVFHNAYGPDKPWFYDRELSGGGCVMDLGVHLADLALWALDFPEVREVSSTLVAGGAPLKRQADQVEDYATATLQLENGASVRLACSWRLNAGCEAQISASFYGTQGGAEMRNVGGSFYDFAAHLNRGTTAEILTEGPDAWGGRAAVEWARRLAAGERFDPECRRLVQLSQVLDRVYGR